MSETNDKKTGAPRSLNGLVRPCFCGFKPTPQQNQGGLWWLECNEDGCDLNPTSPLRVSKRLAIHAWNKGDFA